MGKHDRYMNRAEQAEAKCADLQRRLDGQADVLDLWVSAAAKYQRLAAISGESLRRAQSDVATLRQALEDQGYHETDCAECQRNMDAARKALATPIPPNPGEPVTAAAQALLAARKKSLASGSAPLYLEQEFIALDKAVSGTPNPGEKEREAL